MPRLRIVQSNANTSDREIKAKALRDRFVRVSRRIERPERRRRLLRRLTWVAISFFLLFNIVIWSAALSPWPMGLTLRHVGAMPNCVAARAVGLTPAYRGEPGYWPWLDADKDGKACEPWRIRE